MDIIISAIICTHNRATYLNKAICSLIDQTLSKEKYEIIVVDNTSTDETRQIVERCQVSGVRCQVELETCNLAPSTYNLKYIYEPTLGLSQARNTGWQNAKGEYVAYLDDDAVAAPNWLEKIINVFDTIKPKPGCVAGRVELIWEVPKPEWLSDKLLGQLTLLDWGQKSVILNQKQWFAGANMAFPKKVLEKTGGFKTFLGRKGANLLSMEENLLRKEIEKIDYKCFYAPQAVVKHHILPSRLTKKWFLDRAYWSGASSALVDMYLEPTSFLKAIIKGTGAILRVLLSPKELFSLFSKSNKPQLFELKCSVYARLGHVFALCATRYALCKK